MKAQASSNIKAQAPIKGGGPPTSVWCLRQIVARRFVILTRDPRSKHQGSSCVNLSYIFLIKKMRLSFYVNLTNGGKNGINLRLQKLLCQRLVRTGLRDSKLFLLDSKFCRHPGGDGKKSERNFFQIKFPKKDWFPGLHRRQGSRLCDQVPGQVDRLQIQREGRTTVQIHSKMDQVCGKRSGRKIISLTSGPGREIALGFLIIIINNCDKAQASSWTKAQALGGTRPQARCAVMSH